MRRVVSILVAAAALCLAAGCGSSTPPAGQAQAAQACQTSGSAAATLASQAAAVNPKYATLAADEQANAANQSTTESELSDGNSGDDGSLGALAGTESIGTGGGVKVITDCVSLGLSVSHK